MLVCFIFYNSTKIVKERGIIMPFITFEGPDNLTKETKAKLISELTKTASQILNIPVQAFSVIIKENSMDNIGVGGVQLYLKI